MSVELPIDIITTIAEYCYADAANKLYNVTKNIKCDTTMHRISIKKKFESANELQKWQANNFQFIRDSIEEPDSIYHNEHNFILYVCYQLTRVGIIDAYDFSFRKRRPQVWKFFKNKAWLVDSVYRVKLGTLMKISARPNVAAVVY